MLKLKDYVTLGNLACGFAATIAVIEDHFDLGCYLVLAGYIFDVLDGLVARLTRQYNKFGSELDNLCDLVTYTVAPGFLIYQAFVKIAQWPWWLAAIIGFLPLAVGTIRAARYNVRRLEYPGFFIGLPRPAFALWMIALLRSSTFQFIGELIGTNIAYIIPAGLVIFACILFVSYIPFVGHHDRKFKGTLKVGLIFFFTSIPVGILAGLLLVGSADLVFDLLLFDLLCYVFVSYYVVPPEEKKAIKNFIIEWKKMGEDAEKTATTTH